MKVESKLSSKFSLVCLQFLLLGMKVYFERACRAVRLPESLRKPCGGRFVRGWKVEFASFQLWDLGLHHSQWLLGKKYQAAKLTAGLLHRTGGEVWKQKLCTRCLGQTWAGENQRSGSRAPKASAWIQSQTHCDLLPPSMSASVCEDRNTLLRKVSLNRLGCCFGKKSNMGKLYGLFSR